MAIALASAFGLAAAAFIVTEPYALLDSGRYIAAIMEQSEVVRRIRDYPYTRQYVDTIPVVYQAWHLTLFGLGPLLGLVALGGLVWAGVKVLWRGGAELTLLLAFLVPTPRHYSFAGGQIPPLPPARDTARGAAGRGDAVWRSGLGPASVRRRSRGGPQRASL